MRGDERAELLDPAALIQVANGLRSLIDQSPCSAGPGEAWENDESADEEDSGESVGSEAEQPDSESNE
jgi:hypothetical protein